MFQKWLARKASFSGKPSEKRAKGSCKDASSFDEEFSRSSGEKSNIPVVHRRVISLPADAFYHENQTCSTTLPKGAPAEFIRVLQQGTKCEQKQVFKQLRDAQSDVKAAFVEAGGAPVLLEHLKSKRPQKEGLQALVSLLETSRDLQVLFAEQGVLSVIVKQLNGGTRACKKWAARAVPSIVGCCPDAEEALASSGGLVALVAMLHSTKERRREVAARALASLAKDNQEIRKKIADHDGLADLSALLPKGKAVTRSMVVSTLANVIASDPDLQARAAAVGGEHLLRQLKEENLLLKEESARAVALITAVPQGREVVLEKNGVHDLMEMVDLGKTQQEEWVLEALLNLTKQKDAMVELLEEGVIKQLTQVLQVGTVVAREKSLGILGQLSEFDKFNQRWIMEGQVIPVLVSLLYENCGSVQEGASFVLANISEGLESRRRIYESGAIKPLVTILGCSNGAARCWAGHILSKMASVEDLVLGMVNEGVVDAIVKLLTDGANSHDQWAIDTLRAVAQAPYPWIRGLICSTGVVDVLLEFVASGVPAVQVASTLCLGHLVDNHWESQQMVLGIGVQPLIQCLGSESVELCHAAVHTLSKLSHMESCKCDISAQWQTIRSLAELLHADEVSVRKDAATVLADLASIRGPAMVIIHTEGIVTLLLDMLQSDRHEGIGQAARALGNLALQSPVAKMRVAGSEGALFTLVKTLDESDFTTRAQGAHALASIVMHDASLQAHLAELGVIRPLVDMLKSIDAECNLQAARALAYLVEDHPPNQLAVSLTGALDHLLQLLATGSSGCKREAAHAVATLTHHSMPNQLAVVRGAGVPTLVELLDGDDAEARRYAVRTFANLASSNEVPVIDARRAAIAPLISIISTGDNKCREQAARALANLACSTSEQELIAKVKGIPPLVELVRSGSCLAQEQAARALANLSCKDANLHPILENGGIQALVDLLGSPSGACKKQAAGALANLACNNSENCSAVVNAGGVPDLVALLSSENEACREQAVRAVGNLACSHENQKALLAEGCAKKLISMLKWSEDKIGCKQRVVRALANMAADNEENQIAIIQDGAVEALIQLLSSREYGFQDETKRALMLLACGTDSKVQSEVTEIQGARATVVASILGVRLSSQKHSFAKMRFLQEGGDNEGVPRQLVCPITHELMQEPVVAEDGHTYEKAAIVEWFRNRNSSPMTNEHLKSTQVIPNVLVHAIISDYKESKKEAAPL